MSWASIVRSNVEVESPKVSTTPTSVGRSTGLPPTAPAFVDHGEGIWVDGVFISAAEQAAAFAACEQDATDAALAAALAARDAELVERAEAAARARIARQGAGQGRVRLVTGNEFAMAAAGTSTTEPLIHSSELEDSATFDGDQLARLEAEMDLNAGAITKHDTRLTSLRNMSRLHETSVMGGDMAGLDEISMTNKTYNSFRRAEERSVGRSSAKAGFGSGFVSGGGGRAGSSPKSSTSVRRAKVPASESPAAWMHPLSRRSLRVIASMINAGHCATPSGVVGVGKESVVLAVPASGSVIKVFGAGVSNKGASRERLDSDFRFERRARHSRSARKMSVLWAEKEMRNLKRMSRVRGLRSPVAQLLRENVVLMTMVGGEGDAQRPAPRLKNVRFDQEVSLPGDEVDTTVDLELLGREQERARRTRKALARQAREGETRDSGRASDAYVALAEQMRLMFQGARLVHGDLSEYNVLMGPSGSPVIIDVSQAVDTSSPIAERLLRLDCIALAGFFSSWCDRPLSPRALLRFIKDSDGSRPADLFRASDGPMDPRAWVDVDWDDLETSDPFEEIRYARLKLRQAHGYGDEVDDDEEEEEEEEDDDDDDSAFLSHEEEVVVPLP